MIRPIFDVGFDLSPNQMREQYLLMLDDLDIAVVMSIKINHNNICVVGVLAPTAPNAYHDIHPYPNIPPQALQEQYE